MSEFKYKVKNILENTPVSEYDKIRLELLNKLEISNSRLSQLLNLKVGDEGDWKGNQLFLVAEVLGVSVDDLYPTPLKRRRKVRA